MEGLITILLVFIAFDTSSISSKLDKINQNLIDIKEQIKKGMK